MKKITATTTAWFAAVVLLSAQVPIGQIVDQSRGQSFTLFSNSLMIQNGNPMNRGFVVPDPSGIMYKMIPSQTPHHNAFFIAWNNQIVEVDRIRGPRVIGFCQCPAPVNPYFNAFRPPVFRPNVGFNSNQGFRQIPNQLVNRRAPYGRLMHTSEEKAKSCYNSSKDSYGNLNKEEFGECMMKNMASKKEYEIFQCVQNSDSPEEQTLCLFGALGGQREQQIANSIRECYRQFGDDFEKYPLCMAGQQVDPEVQKVLSCMQQQSRTGTVSISGVALCYGADKLNLNTEAQIVLECAIASGGEPYSTLTCSGGRLVARELDKCLSNGIGGDNGCFGKNNDIIKAIEGVGDVLTFEYGQSNEIVKLWNNGVREITQAPGNVINELGNVANQFGNAGQEVIDAVSSIIPKLSW